MAKRSLVTGITGQDGSYLGGRVLVVCPVDRAMYLARVLCLRFKEAAFDPAHLRQWNARDLRREMRKVGLRPIATRSMPLLWPFMLHGLVVGERTA